MAITEFPHDGTVFRVKYSYFEKLAYTAHHLRGAYAFKKREAGVVTNYYEWNGIQASQHCSPYSYS